jgi:hydrogenase maturation factor HypF (carbamoyltransferase family)
VSRFDPKRPVVATTMLWQRSEDGQWSRFMIREQTNRPPVVSALHRVPQDVPVCMACLSTNVVLLDSDRYEDGELYCNDCGTQYGFVV